MFESTYLVKVSKWALGVSNLDKQYNSAWEPLVKHFDPSWKREAAGVAPK